MTGMILALGSGTATPSNSAQTFCNFQSSAANNWTADEAILKQPAPIGFTITSFDVKATSASGAAKNFTFAVRVNGVDSAMTVLVENTTAVVSNTTPLAINQGDLLSIGCTPSGTPTTSIHTISFKYDSGAGNGQPVFGGTNNVMSQSVTNYSTWQGTGSINSTETNRREIFPTAGTVRNMFVNCSAAPGATTEEFVVTTMLGGSGQTLACTVTGTATTDSDTSNSFAVVATNVISVEMNPNNTPAAVVITWGYEFLPTTAGETVHMFGGTNAPSASASNFQLFTGTIGWNGTEGNRKNIGYTGYSMKNLYVLVGTAPGAAASGKQYTISVNEATVATALSVVLFEVETTDSNTGTTISLTDGNLINWGSVPLNTPNGAGTMALSVVSTTAQASETLSRISTLPFLGAG